MGSKVSPLIDYWAGKGMGCKVNQLINGRKVSPLID